MTHGNNKNDASIAYPARCAANSSRNQDEESVPTVDFTVGFGDRPTGLVELLAGDSRDRAARNSAGLMFPRTIGHQGERRGVNIAQITNIIDQVLAELDGIEVDF